MVKKSVVYLFGSGATHAVVNFLDNSKGLLTSNVREVIRKRGNTSFPTNIWNELIDDRVDIEHLISVLESNYDYKTTNELRWEYSEAISSLSKGVVSLTNSNENLYSVLLDLYSIKGFTKEKISCILTLNYEDILEESIKLTSDHKYDYGMEHSKSVKLKKAIPILKLHGSFNWKNVRPIEVDSMESVIANKEALWIPPGVEKKKEKYPFNLLWGKAFEYLLDCDVLRIIGCSLNRNDWDLIPLIYTTNKLNKSGKSFEIEFIDYPDQCNKVISQYEHFNLKHIYDLPEISSFLLKEYFPHLSASDSIPSQAREELTENITPLKHNIFSIWLQAVGENLLNKGVDLTTPNKIFNTFIRNGQRA